MLSADQATKEDGFTLIEVIVSFVILTMILGSVTLSLSYATRLQRMGDAKQRAMTCAEQIIAEKFSRQSKLPKMEVGDDKKYCRWRMTRTVSGVANAVRGRRVMTFRLDVLDQRDRAIDTFEAPYVEVAP